MEDRELLRQYTEHQSEAAFSELVSRHVNLVYSAALRMVGDAHQARDVAQTVFIGLARKPHAIRDAGALGAWLYRSAQHAALNVIRSETRRRHRETEAMNRAELNEATPAAWDAIGPYLDEALRQLNPAELDVVVLRYFEGKSLRETGDALALTENAVQKRASRALDKLREHFSRRGVTATATVLAALMAGNSAKAAPVGLATNLASASLAGAGTTTLAGSLLHIFSMTTRTKIIMTTVALIAVAAIPLTLEIQKINDLNSRLGESDRRAKVAALQRTRDQEEIKLLKDLLAALQVGKSADASAGQPTTRGLLVNLIRDFSDLLQLSFLRDMVAKSARQNAGRNYAGVMEHLQLSPEEREQFLQLMTDREMSEYDSMAKMLSPATSAADRAALFQHIQDLEASSNLKIKEFLNDDDGYAYFLSYTDQKTEREKVGQLNDTLGASGLGLTTGQMDQLTGIMHEARSHYKFTLNFKDNAAGFDPANITDEAVTARIQEEKDMQNEIAEKAADILSPAQLNALRQSQAQELDTMKQGFGLYQQLLTSGK